MRRVALNAARERAEDSVFVDVASLRELALDGRFQVGQQALALRGTDLGIKHRFELLHEEADELRVLDQHVFHVVL